MANDENVTVKFGAQLQGLNAGIAEAKGALQSLTAPISGIISAFSGVAAALSAAFSIDKLKQFEDKFAELGEQIERTAKITGLSTTEVQDFGLAIRLAGGDSDTAAQTLKILEKNIGEAESGSGRAYTAFTNLGVSLDDLKNKTPLDILFQMKARMDEAGDSAGQAAIKVEYMRAVAGRAGADFLALGSNLDEVKKIAQQTGTELDPVMVQKADSLAHSNHVLGESFAGLAHTLADELAPAYQSVIDKMSSAAQGTNNFLSLFGSYSRSVAAASSKKKGNAGLPDLSSGLAGLDSDYAKQNTKPLEPLATVGAGAGKADDSADKDHADAQIALSKLVLAQKVQDLDAEQAAGQITEKQKISGLIEAANQEHTIDQDVLDKQLLSDQEYSDKSTILAQQHALEISKLQEQLAKSVATSNEKSFNSATEIVTKDLDTMLQGVLQGTQTMQQAFVRMADNIALSFIEAIATMTVKWIGFEILTKEFNVTGLTNPFQQLEKVLSQMWTTITGVTAATTAQTAATTATAAASTTAAAAQSAATGASVTKHAASAAAAVYDDVAQIPYVGWLLAPPAAAAAFAAVEAFGGFETGTDYVPSTGFALLHQGEAVIPAGQNNGPYSGGNGQGNTININLQAIDNQSGTQFLLANMPVIAQGISTAIRNNNSSLSNAARA